MPAPTRLNAPTARSRPPPSRAPARRAQVIAESADFRSHQLPLARIKKIMKSDEEVQMISAEAPMVFAKACELFISELTLRSWLHTRENKRRTLQRNDIATAVTKSGVYDFLIDIVPREEVLTKAKTDTMLQSDQLQYLLQFQQSQLAQAKAGGSSPFGCSALLDGGGQPQQQQQLACGSAAGGQYAGAAPYASYHAPAQQPSYGGLGASGECASIEQGQQVLQTLMYAQQQAQQAQLHELQRQQQQQQQQQQHLAMQALAMSQQRLQSTDHAADRHGLRQQQQQQLQQQQQYQWGQDHQHQQPAASDGYHALHARYQQPAQQQQQPQYQWGQENHLAQQAMPAQHMLDQMQQLQQLQQAQLNQMQQTMRQAMGGHTEAAHEHAIDGERDGTSGSADLRERAHEGGSPHEHEQAAVP